ncbi:hypothetical protein B0H16DRAFT_1788202 [Mycena metata]|uniref:Uncharacterized protein n=1 Tax=Mycena metata TaxID=1033252 RepID=A0AAD7HKW7_9AGAR|nr:hypothetical protein B0H16DRAFT_1788202 [Mycena metata]
MVLLADNIPQALTGSTKSWGQMLYTGSLALWMSPVLNEDSREQEYTEAPIYHLPAFLLDAHFTGDASFPVQDHPKFAAQAHPQFGSAPLLTPQGVRAFCPLPLWEQHTQAQDLNLWPETPSEDTSSSTSTTAPPWPSYNEQYYIPKPLPPFEGRLGGPRRLPSPPSSPIPITLPHTLRSPIFHVPTAEEIAAHLDAAEELCRQRALEPPFPRVFVPPPPPNNSPASAPIHHPPSSPAPRDHSLTPFRIIPSLPVRFPMLFGADVEFEAEGMDASDGTFSDVNMLTDSEEDEYSCAEDEAEVFFDAESELEN